MTRILLTIAAALAAAHPAPAADDKFVTITHADGRVLAVADDSDEAGAAVVVAKAGGSKSQQWQVVEDGKFLKLVNRKSGKVLDVFEDSRDEDAKVIVYDEKAEENDNQRWAWVGQGKARRLRSKSSELVLGVDGEGNVVQKKADDKEKGQLWTVRDVK